MKPNRARELAIGVACTHCGLAVPRGLVSAAPGPQFCCSGCRTAYQLLHDHGLEAYYTFGDRRESAVSSSGRSYEEFDHPAFADLYVRPTSGGRVQTEFYLESVHCASCVWLIERVPLLIPGVARAELEIRRSLARIEWDPGEVSLAAVARMLDRLGYPPHPFRGVTRDAMRRREDRRMLMRIGVAGAIAGNVMLASLALYSGEFSGMDGSFAGLFRWLSMGLATLAVVFPGRLFFSGAWSALRTRTLHMDLPIALALGAGLVRGGLNTVTNHGPIYFDGVTVLIFLLLVGRYLQQRGQRAASDAAELLHSLAPDRARVLDAEGNEQEVPASALLPGMEVLVRPGESVPADGTVSHGESAINAALLTGEAMPSVVRPGVAVFAGTLNVASPLRIRVDAAGEESRLARLMRQVEESARRRAPVVALANRMSGWFVLVVLMLAVVTWLLWHGRSETMAWDNAIALLIVTCPCALALATPLAITVALGRAARGGILIKGGDALELLSRPGQLLLDKTGTVTAGECRLQQWIGDPSVQPLVLALEADSTHPIAAGFREAWPEVVPGQATLEHHQVGGGVSGIVNGRRVVVGSPAFVARHATGGAEMLARLGDAELTPVLVSVDGVVVAGAGLGDTIRSGSLAALDRLRAAGWETALLSGDDPRVVRATGAKLGFTAHASIGGATPEAKLAQVHHHGDVLRGSGRPVVMVGDGINDAAAIAAASVGVGVHGGAEACLATADVYLATPGIGALVDLIEGSRRTMRIIRRNIVFALCYNVVGVALAMTGTISPLTAALLMPASSLTVLLGSWLGRSFDAPTMAAVAPFQPARDATVEQAA